MASGLLKPMLLIFSYWAYKSIVLGLLPVVSAGVSKFFTVVEMI